MMTLRLYDRDGTTLLGLLPQALSYQASFEFNDLGAISVEYPSDGINANLLTELREIAVLNASGVEHTNGRFVITGINRDRVAVDGTITITGKSILWRLETALAYPTGGVASGEITRWFDSKNPGYIVRTLVDEAKARGALTGITCTFNTTTDSNGAAWNDSVTQEYPARVSLLSVVRGLQDFGIFEVETVGRTIRATGLDGIGSDLTTLANPVVLRYGQSLTEAPEQISAERLASVALVEGDNGLLVERSNAGAVTSFGRLETSLTASGIDDTAVVNDLGDAYLANIANPARQLTVGLAFFDGAPRPLDDFKVGDYVYTATSSGVERVRVRQITISMNGGVISATATLGDRIYENEIRSTRQLSSISSGSVSLGNGGLVTQTPTIVPDAVAPAAPSGLNGTSVSYLDGNAIRGRVDLAWTAPTLNADGTPLTDLRQYEIEFRQLTTDPWQYGGATAGTTFAVSNLTKSTQYRFRVAAVDSSNNRSAYSNVFVISTAGYVEIPAQPSAPVVTSRLGVLSVIWDGLNYIGGAMPIDLDYVAIYLGTTAGFTPSGTNYRGRIEGPGPFYITDLEYSTTYYVKLVAYNTSGVYSPTSNSGSAEIKPLVNTDIIADTINGGKIKDGTIVASEKIEALSITGGQIAALTIEAGKIAANAITADKIVAGAIDGKVITGANIRTADATARVELTSAGFKAYNSSGAVTVAINTNGSATFTGSINGTSGYLGSATNGWNFSSSGVLQNSGGTTILYPTTNPGGNANNYALYSDRGVLVDKVFANATTASAIYSSGGVFAVSTLTAGNFGFTVNASGNITACGGISMTGAIVTSGGISTTGTAAIDAAGELYARLAQTATVTAATNCFVTSSGQVRRTSTTSSIRFKENVTPIMNVPGLDPKALLNLPVIGFTYKEGHIPSEDDRYMQMLPGFIAEDVDALYPIAADYEDGEIQTWNERMIIPGLLALIQDLNTKVNALEERLNGETA